MVFGTPGGYEGSDAVSEGVKAATSLVPTMALFRGYAPSALSESQNSKQETRKTPESRNSKP